MNSKGVGRWAVAVRPWRVARHAPRRTAAKRGPRPGQGSMAVSVSQRCDCAAEAAPARAVRARDAARERRARRAQVRGYGMSGDAHHITQPPEDGGGAALAVRRALADGALRPADVACVNAHATGARASSRPCC